MGHRPAIELERAVRIDLWRSWGSTSEQFAALIRTTLQPLLPTLQSVITSSLSGREHPLLEGLDRVLPQAAPQLSTLVLGGNPVGTNPVLSQIAAAIRGGGYPSLQTVILKDESYQLVKLSGMQSHSAAFFRSAEELLELPRGPALRIYIDKVSAIVHGC